MSEARKEERGGWLRLFVHKLEKEESWDNGFEILESDYFSTDLSVCCGVPFLDIQISEHGFDWFDESIQQILEPYAVGDVVEIVGEAVFEFWKSWTDMGYEHDAAAWIDNEKHRKLPDDEAIEYLKKAEGGASESV